MGYSSDPPYQEIFLDQSKMQKQRQSNLWMMDNVSVAVNLNLKTCLTPDTVERARPLNYSERTCSVLPVENNLLQEYLNDAEKFAEDNKMKINPNKTKIVSFNKSRKYDFLLN